MYIYDALTGELVSRLSHHRASVRDVSWHPTLPILCSSSWDGSVAVVQYSPGGARVDPGAEDDADADDGDESGDGSTAVNQRFSLLMAGGGGADEDEDGDYEVGEGEEEGEEEGDDDDDEVGE